MVGMTDKEICEKQGITHMELERRQKFAKDQNAWQVEQVYGITREEYDKLPTVPIRVCSRCGTAQETKK